MTGCSNGSKAGDASCRSGMVGTATPRSAAVIDGAHAGPGERRARVDRADAAVRDRAAQDRRVQQIGAREIVDELPAPAQETRILEPLDRAADEGVAHGSAVLIRPHPDATSPRTSPRFRALSPCGRGQLDVSTKMNG